jgi:8-oxo-(d)GTP phosphatase
MPDRDGNPTIRAAGAVVWRGSVNGDGPSPGATEVVLVHRPRYDDWSFPKGKVEPGEHVLHAAVREVAEETGLRVVLGRALPESTYPVAGGLKRVSYWAARCVESERFTPGDEVDQVDWLAVDEARQRLSYERDRWLLRAFASGPLATAPLILLRHASAGRALATDAENLARPLDVQGAADSRELAGLLACYGRCRVISSAARRCTDTVRPYAAASGAQVEVDPLLTVPPGGHAHSVRELAARLAESGEPALICAHRENLPPLIEGAYGALCGAVPEIPPLAKGAFLVLQSAGGSLASAERHDVGAQPLPRGLGSAGDMERPARGADHRGVRLGEERGGRRDRLSARAPRRTVRTAGPGLPRLGG